jgi:hypothetical protein
LPDQEHKASSGTQRPADINKGGNRIGEEHHPKTADAQVEILRGKRMDLRVGHCELDVPQSFFRGACAGHPYQLFGDVHAEHASVYRRAGGFPSGLPGSTADIEHAIPRSDVEGSLKAFVVPP